VGIKINVKEECLGYCLDEESLGLWTYAKSE
jgi:hypothetical protein